jgi:hypothetical protein
MHFQYSTDRTLKDRDLSPGHMIPFYSYSFAAFQFEMD